MEVYTVKQVYFQAICMQKDQNGIDYLIYTNT